MNETTYRISEWDRERLATANAGLFHIGMAEDRVDFYVRKGHSVADSVEYAIAWARNMVEQHSRRLGHDTGAEGWRRVR